MAIMIIMQVSTVQTCYYNLYEDSLHFKTIKMRNYINSINLPSPRRAVQIEMKTINRQSDSILKNISYISLLSGSIIIKSKRAVISG